MTFEKHTTPIILIPGHWLGAWAWDTVAEHLAATGHRPYPLTLPGLDPHDAHRADRTLADQADAIEQAMTGAAGSPDEHVIIVAHSGANAPVSMVLDRHPERVAHAIWVDSGPVATGSVFAPDLPVDIIELPLPPLETLAEQASLDGLDETALETFVREAVAEPGPVLTQPVELANPARRSVPTTLVCCSISGAQIIELARSGHPMFSEVATLTDAEFIDLPTGHWPMWSRPLDLAQIIGTIATTTQS